MTNNLILYKSENFQGITCDLWKDNNDDILMTREQIGIALEYSYPQEAIQKIHDRNNDRLDKYSVQVKLTSTDRKQYNTTVYNTKGIYEICRFSRQKKANAFMDFVWDLLEKVRKDEITLLQTQLVKSQPKIDFYKQCVSANNNLTMLQASKILKIGRNKLFLFLRNSNVLMIKKDKHNLPYERFIKQRYFTVVVNTVIKNSIVKDTSTTLVTARGLAYIQKILKNKEKALSVNKAI